MTLPDVVSRADWVRARTELLAREKEFTRARDKLNADRRRLPMVRIDKAYRFEGADGPTDLIGLFGEGRQLIVQHVMFDPNWDDACGSCTAAIDEIASGLIDHLKVRDTAFALVSRAPLAKLGDYAGRRGWTVPWYSSYGSDFNYDFHVTMDESVTAAEYNYRSSAEYGTRPTVWSSPGKSAEQPGFSCFLRDGEEVFHTYSAFARGTEQLGGGYAFLDMTALGRQEEWEEPKGRAAAVRTATPDFAS